MQKQFIEFIDNHNLFTTSDSILLAVSGGIDSMVMLDLFSRFDFKIAIAHCNFQLREEDSDKDESFVKQYAVEQNIPFFSVRFETEKYAEQKKISTQMAARELRYEWFYQIAQKYGFNYIATAHHQDDVIETFFLNLLRKTGIRGLHGIREKAGKIIRPLIFTAKKDIENYANENQILFREDITNRSDHYKRNYIRHHIVPQFRNLQPDFDNTLSETIHILSEQEEIYTAHLQQEIKKMVTSADNMLQIDIQELLKSPYRQTYLFEILYPYDFNAAQVKDIIFVLENKHEPGSLFYSDTHTLLVDRDKLLLQTKNQATENEVLIKDKFSNNVMRHENLTFEKLENNSAFIFDPQPNIAYFDADKIFFPLILRSWKTGDAFYPFGMRGKKKVSDYFTDMKLSRFAKESTSLLCNANEDILWIVGYRSDERYKVSSSTKSILKVTVL